MKVYMVYIESNVNGEITFDAIPCSSLDVAKKILKEERDWVINESYHFSQYTLDELKNDEEFEFIDNEKRFFIQDMSDDYWEDYAIVEKELKE